MAFGKITRTLAVFFGISAAVSAHNFLPLPADGSETNIPDISVSRAAYREILIPGQLDAYAFTAKAGSEIYIQMTVPAIPRFLGLRPRFALVSLDGAFKADGAFTVEGGAAVPVPPEILAELGGAAAENAMAFEANEGPGKAFHEEFTGTDYLMLQTLTMKAPVTGRFRIGVYLPEGSLGKYVLATGKKEYFTLKDIFGLGKVKRDIRAFMEVSQKP